MSEAQLHVTGSLQDDTPPSYHEEREFIRGNRDGADGTSDTYTVCRLRVSRKRLDREMIVGMHSHFFSLSKCWDCPAHIFLKAEKKAEERREKRGGGNRRPPPPVVSLQRWRTSGLMNRSVEGAEIIQQEPGRSGAHSSFTICRIAVPRERMVLEVKEGLHPGYHVRRRKGGGLPEDDPRRLYVKGNPTEPFDNVDYPKSRKAVPGFSSKDLCPFRLLRPGAQLRA